MTVDIAELDDLAVGSDVMVEGYLWGRPSGAVVCEALEHSLPPACAGEQAAATLDQESQAALSASVPDGSGVRWSEQRLRIRGEITDAGFVVEEVAAVPSD